MTEWTVVWSNTAREQSIEVQAWWSEHRSAAPTLFVDELADILELLKLQPRAGCAYDHPTVKGLRRVLLMRSRYQVIFRVDETQLRVELVAIWHSLRGSAPPLDR